MRAWREAKSIGYILLAPERLVTQATIRMSYANNDLQAVRELDCQDWDLGLAFLQTQAKLIFKTTLAEALLASAGTIVGQPPSASMEPDYKNNQAVNNDFG
jgi:hypothetical protein